MAPAFHRAQAGGPISERAGAGFTLVELAIVLVVIGLIIGGVLKGQEMIESARVSRTVADLDAMRAAHLTFVDKYRALPGDFRDGQAVLGDRVGVTWTTPSCDGGVNRCDGDGLLDTISFGWAGESAMYWQHLAASGMTNLVDVRADASDAFPTLPTGGFLRTIMVTVPGYDRAIWHYNNQAIGDFRGGLSGERAFAIDTKLDDGRPGTGDVLQLDDGACVGGRSFAADNVYVVDASDCEILIRMDG